MFLARSVTCIKLTRADIRMPALKRRLQKFRARFEVEKKRMPLSEEKSGGSIPLMHDSKVKIGEDVIDTIVPGGSVRLPEDVMKA